MVWRIWETRKGLKWERCLSVVQATLAFSTLALICPKFPSFWHTVHAMNLYDNSKVSSLHLLRKKNGILFFSNLHPSHQIPLQKSLFLNYSYCLPFPHCSLKLQFSVITTSYRRTASQGALGYVKREKPISWSLISSFSFSWYFPLCHVSSSVQLSQYLSISIKIRGMNSVRKNYPPKEDLKHYTGFAS